jgi:hypothetical protein
LIYKFGGQDVYQQEAEQHANQAVECYTAAITFISHEIDQERGAIKGRWLGGKVMTLPELIEREKQEREQLPQLFQWEGAGHKPTGAAGETAPPAGTFAPAK